MAWPDVIHLFILQLLKKVSRVLYNITVLFIPWEVRIKKIESEWCLETLSVFTCINVVEACFRCLWIVNASLLFC